MKQNCNVPAFLSKLWTLVEDHSTNDLICWSQDGSSFLVCDEQRFSKEILPLYFKHSNMTSFVRQLNMYGFHKVVQVDAGLPRDSQRVDSVEFQHPHFRQTQPHLLGLIRRKVSVSRGGEEGMTQVSQVLLELGQVRSWQDISDSKLMGLRRENESLWREVDSLRQRYQQQHKIIRKIIHFIASTVQSKGITGIKRKLPLMIDSSGVSHSPPKYSRSISMDHSQPTSTLHGIQLDSVSGSVYPNGMIISDITHLLEPLIGAQKHRRAQLTEGQPQSSVGPSLSSPPTPTVELDLSLLEDAASSQTGQNSPDRIDPCDPLALIDSCLPLSPGPSLDLLTELFSPAPCSPGEGLPTDDLGGKQGTVQQANSSNTQTDKQTVATLGWDAPQKDGGEEEEEGGEGTDMLPALLQLAEEVSDFTYLAAPLSLDAPSLI
ncbi:hypothetical protein MATL_G00046820 [Megalops atlanticus]|uniref:HSF-type DNA-binding domain-containing protein n=1 Tax=Megalops atlanticus TaxID=7932 RepID=A0A9D3QFD5_MEGAT|nr:hypothetical protein MATL_G00046820 [Megalops atlanticus]